jgi:hypothetical protein
VSELSLLPSSYHWTIDGYQFGRARAFERTKEVRCQRAYFAKGSVPYEHFNRRLGAEQSRMIELRETCLEARHVAIMQQDLRDEPSPSDLDMLAAEAAALGRAA